MNLNPLDQFEWWVMVAVAVIVIGLYFALRRVYVRPYLAVMEEREAYLAQAEETLAEADRIRNQAEARAAETVSEAERDAESCVDEARARADAYRSQCVTEARARSSEELRAGRERIQLDREAATEAMRDDAVECVLMACERLVGEVDQVTAERAVDDALARLEG